MAGAVALAATTSPRSRTLLRRRRSCSLLLALLLCASHLPPTPRAFELRGAYGGGDEKVPLAVVIVPDPSPELSGLPPAPLAAPPPLHGGGGDDTRPRLPTERWRRGGGDGAARRAAAAHAPAGAPSAGGPARAPAQAPAPESGSSAGAGAASSITSSPAVAVPRGVTDTATILPMPAPGEKRQEVGAAVSSSVQAACVVVPLLLGFIVMMPAF
ncbi:hypothetical protein BS78_04G156900 [Paspalum vaginatum]|nr:hypothetical protein BS78_04G156900 [Paspalum vaginatum]